MISNDEILPIPVMPTGIREAAQRGVLIPFIGAGVSVLAGCPTWPQFADGSLAQYVEAAKISHAQIEQIKHLHPRVKLSMARGLEAEHHIPLDFRKLLHPTGRNNHLLGRELYGSLSKLGKTFVTTNHDEWLDEDIDVSELMVDAPTNPAHAPEPKSRNIYHRVEDLTASNLNRPNTVIHLHGSVLAPEGMILTTQDYIRHYANDRMIGDSSKENRVLTFLENLFKHKTVLFVGYGLEELEILEYVILKARHLRTSGQPEAKHYLLQGFFSHQQGLVRSLKQYYLRECGIQLIPFLRDQRDWAQLLEVIKEFGRLAPASAPMYLQEFKEMEDLLGN
jgi:hypothetical protein